MPYEPSEGCISPIAVRRRMLETEYNKQHQDAEQKVIRFITCGVVFCDFGRKVPDLTALGAFASPHFAYTSFAP